ncbi:MAG: HAMP domain-containing sensor histidine kinase [Dehalococcoidales bacterium]|nr:HAMP domain-containing sensor histidine kinase [Dehalococcoidales bacterium]
MRLSLRSLLSLWVAIAILIIIFGVIIATQQVTVWRLEVALNENMQKHAHTIASIISSDITTDEASYARVFSELSRQELSFAPSIMRVISPTGQPIIEFGEMSPALIQNLNSQLLVDDAGSGHFSDIFFSDADPVKAYTITVFEASTQRVLAHVQVIESLRQIADARNGLLVNGIIVGMTGSLIAIIAVRFMIRRGFRPLQEMMQTIDQVDYNHLNARMHDEGQPAEIEQLAKSLSAMWLRLDTAISKKQQAIGSMSHDLRTPLTAIQGQIEVLLSQPSLDDETKDSLERMLKETQRLIRMVRNLLLNAQLDSNIYIQKEPVNLKEMLDEVVGDMWMLTRGLELNIIAPDDIFIQGNHDLLKQMLVNLVDNSIKFTPQNGQIKMLLARKDGQAFLQVKDTGRGIPEEQLPHVMKAFYKVGSTRKSDGEGSRLGLAIVKQIVEIHNGRIEIQSLVGVGTSVTIHLPLQEIGESAGEKSFSPGTHRVR